MSSRTPARPVGRGNGTPRSLLISHGHVSQFSPSPQQHQQQHQTPQHQTPQHFYPNGGHPTPPIYPGPTPSQQPTNHDPHNLGLLYLHTHQQPVTPGAQPQAQLRPPGSGNGHHSSAHQPQAQLRPSGAVNGNQSSSQPQAQLRPSGTPNGNQTSTQTPSSAHAQSQTGAAATPADDTELGDTELGASNDEERSDFDLPPPPEAIYRSEEELEAAINAWSVEHGYELVRRNSRKNARGILYKRYFSCGKHGSIRIRDRPADTTRPNRKSARTNCQMSVVAVSLDPYDPSGNWALQHRSTIHNHGPVQAVKLAGHRRRFRTKAIEKAVDDLFALETSNKDALHILQSTYGEDLFTINDVANMKYRWSRTGTCAAHPERTEPTPTITEVNRQLLTVPVACASCQANKLKCDTAKPVCGTCMASDSICLYRDGPRPIYDPSTQSLAAATTGVVMRNNDGDGDSDAEPAGDANGGGPVYTPVAGPPTRLTLQSSSIEILAYASCGTGRYYQNIPQLTDPSGWAAYEEAFAAASRKENTWEVLNGEKSEPLPLANDVSIDEWNEHIRQLAIYRRRNNVLLGALRSTVAPALKGSLGNHYYACALWLALRNTCVPSTNVEAWGRFHDLSSTTLATCGNDFQRYAQTVEMRWNEFNRRLPPPSAVAWQNCRFTEELVCLLFLENLGEEHRRRIEGVCQGYNVGGYGGGERIGFQALVAIVGPLFRRGHAEAEGR